MMYKSKNDCCPATFPIVTDLLNYVFHKSTQICKGYDYYEYNICICDDPIEYHNVLIRSKTVSGITASWLLAAWAAVEDKVLEWAILRLLVTLLVAVSHRLRTETYILLLQLHLLQLKTNQYIQNNSKL